MDTIIVHTTDSQFVQLISDAFAEDHTIRLTATEMWLYHLLATQNVSAIVLDGRLRGATDSCHRIRMSSVVPIIAVAESDCVDERVQLLVAGADDVVTRPFEPLEVAARLQAKVRFCPPSRAHSPANTLLYNATHEFGIRPSQLTAAITHLRCRLPVVDREARIEARRGFGYRIIH